MRIIQSTSPRPLNLLAVGPGGLVAAACGTFGAPGGTEVWDASTGRLAWSVASGHSGFRFLAFLLDGAYFYVADYRGERLFAVPADGEPVVARSIWSAESAARGDRVIVARSGEDSALSCWRAPDMNLVWVRDREDRWNGKPYFGALALDPTGARFALSVREGTTHPKQTVSVRDADTGAPLAAIPFDPASPVQQLAFTADGSKLLLRVAERRAHLFDTATGLPAGELVHTGRAYVTSIAAHPGGPVACARSDGTVTFWDAETRAKLRTLDWKAGRLVSVAFSPDGALGAAGTEDGKVIVWDVDL